MPSPLDRLSETPPHAPTLAQLLDEMCSIQASYETAGRDDAHLLDQEMVDVRKRIFALWDVRVASPAAPPQLTPEWCMEAFYRVNPGAHTTMRHVPSLYLLDFAREVQHVFSGAASPQPSEKETSPAAPPPAGPWQVAPDTAPSTRMCWYVHRSDGRIYFHTANEAEAIAVRDALNRVAAGSPQTPEPR